MRPLLVRADRIHGSFGPDVRGGSRGTADGLVVWAGRVVALGSASALKVEYPESELMDLPGTTITPGLIDSHIHLIEWSRKRREVDLTRATTPDEAASAIAEFGATGVSGEGWVAGHGWSQDRWGSLPDRDVLDRRLAHRPVALHSQDLHALWVNSCALERTGITNDTPDPEGGVIVRDESGRATGILLESATALVADQIPVLEDSEIAEMVRLGQAALHRFGITAVHAFPAVHAHEPADLRILQVLADKDELRLRILQQLPVRALDAAIALGLSSGSGSEWIRIGGIKVFLDGSLGTRTAWLREPYNGGSYRGMSLYSEEVVRGLVEKAADAGLSSTIHAIGDAAVTLAFGLLCDPPLRQLPTAHRIEHVQLCPPDALALAGMPGIVHSVQPAHVSTDWAVADRLWGHPRSAGAYAFRSLLAGGGVLAFGSDAPVADPDPRLGLYAATTRQDLDGNPDGGWYPAERITTREALWAYTGGGALAAGLAGRQGELRPGAFADFAIWDRDPLSLSGAELLDMQCRGTVVGGDLVWFDAR